MNLRFFIFAKGVNSNMRRSDKLLTNLWDLKSLKNFKGYTMDTNSIMMMLQDKLPKDASVMTLRDRLDKASDTKRDEFSKTISMLNLKSPMTGLILGLFLGGLGVDRFYKGDIGLGILKIVTLGGFGIWILVDLFIVGKGIRKDNLQKVMMAI